jgi:multiple sugar transport system substrate-binding protein
MKKVVYIFICLVMLTSVLTACAPVATPTAAPVPAATAAPAATKPAPTLAPQPLVFDSSQLGNVQEVEKMNNIILKPFTGGIVDYVGEANESAQIDRLTAEMKSGKYTVSLIGALHGTFPNLLAVDVLQDLTPLAAKLASKGISKDFMTLGKLGTDKQLYIPWMQATYVMAINKKALQYLPSGYDVNKLTYQQLAAWGKAIFDATKEKKIGLPAGPSGLMHRLTQGYLYPAYTGGLVTTYRSADAIPMWTDLKAIWEYTNPQSTTYNFMQDPLLTEEVWIAWDHTARLGTAFQQKPDAFIAVPAPTGPKGLYYMAVLAGFGIPKNAPNQAGAEALIEFMTTQATQSKTASELGFYPVLDSGMPADMPAYAKGIADAVIAMGKSPNAKVALLPIGLAAKSGDFNKIMQDSFTRIVIKNEDIKTVLEDEANQLNAIMTAVKAPCWAPDPAGTGPCLAK